MTDTHPALESVPEHLACWHFTGETIGSDPTFEVDRCCWCATERPVLHGTRLPAQPAHGTHAPPMSPPPPPEKP
jgi:hypothetical protein